MADNTHIEYSEATWNIITGCSVESPGCKHCYAMKLAGGRLKHHPSREGLTIDTKEGPVWTGEVRFNEEWLRQPIQWTRPRRIFVCAHGDLFHPSVSDEWIDRVFAVMADAPRHTFQVLTKRPGRMRDYLANVEERRRNIAGWHKGNLGTCFPDNAFLHKWPLSHIWVGASVEDQVRADEHIGPMRDIAEMGWLTWVSYEPALGPVDWTPWAEFIGWGVAGGESGANARPMHPALPRAMRDQFDAGNVPYLFKQWGEWVPRSACYHTFEDGKSCADHDPGATKWPCIRLTERGNDGRDMAHVGEGDDAYMQRVGKKVAGRLLDGKLHDGYPEAVV